MVFKALNDDRMHFSLGRNTNRLVVKSMKWSQNAVFPRQGYKSFSGVNLLKV